MLVRGRWKGSATISFFLFYENSLPWISSDSETYFQLFNQLPQGWLKGTEENAADAGLLYVEAETSEVTMGFSAVLKGPAHLWSQRGSAHTCSLSDLDPSLLWLTHSVSSVLAVSMTSTSATVNYYLFVFFFAVLWSCNFLSTLHFLKWLAQELRQLCS